MNQNPKPIALELSHDDCLVINNALNEILHGPDAIDEGEFHTRVGVQKTEALSLAERFKNRIQNIDT